MLVPSWGAGEQGRDREEGSAHSPAGRRLCPHCSERGWTTGEMEGGLRRTQKEKERWYLAQLRAASAKNPAAVIFKLPMVQTRQTHFPKRNADPINLHKTNSLRHAGEATSSRTMADCASRRQTKAPQDIWLHFVVQTESIISENIISR